MEAMEDDKEQSNPHHRVFCVEDVAAIIHEASRRLDLTQGDRSVPEWGEAPNWMRDGVCNGVRFHLEHPDAEPEASHENWLAHKRAEGWRYGEVKDPEQKTHPCMVAFTELPAEHQAKDHLIRGIMAALAPFMIAH